MEPLVKFLVIGGDAACPAHIEKFIRSGDMPNMAALRDRGLSGQTTNPHGLEAGATWPTFHTGLLPGHQPQFDGLRLFDSKTYKERWYRPDEVVPNIWKQLSDQGKRCLIVDVPYAHLDPTINGMMVIDWGSHVPANGRQFSFQTHPAPLADEIRQAIGEDPVGPVMCDRHPRESIDDYRHFIATYMERLGKRARLAKFLIQKGGWDYAEIVFTELHCIGHHLWHVTDPGHPQYDPSLSEALGEPIRDAYRAFDDAIGEIAGLVDERTTFLFYGSHGMGPQYTGTGVLDRVLFHLDKGTKVQRQRSLKVQVLRAWQKLPGGLRARLRPLRKGVRGALQPTRFLPEPETRRFFEVYANNATGGVRINLKGREAKGTVSEEEYLPLLHKIRDELSQLTNGETGEPIAREILVTREHYGGDYAEKLPDLLVSWNRASPIRIVHSPTVGTIRQEFSGYRTGDHTPHGMFIATGEGIAPTVLNAQVTSTDFAPTIAARLGVSLAKTDGTPIAQLART